jgi:hypothetical protein
MAAFTDILEAKVLNAIFNNVSLAYANVWVGLFSAAPNDAGGGTELTIGANGYARVQTAPADWTDATAGACSNANAITFPAASGSQWSVAAFGIFSAASGGDLLGYGTLSTTVPVGVVLEFAAGELDVTLD